MSTITAATTAHIYVRAGRLPEISPSNPEFEIVVGRLKVRVRVTPRAARRLADHEGPALLVGRLHTDDDGRLVLLNAGFEFIK